MSKSISQFIDSRTLVQNIATTDHPNAETIADLYDNRDVFVYLDTYSIAINPDQTYSLILSNREITDTRLIYLEYQLYNFYLENS